MGFLSKITKPFKKVVNKITNSGQGAPEAPTPAPELELTNPEGEAEKKEETEKVQRRKGKKGLRINKDTTSVSGGTGRNLV